MKMKYFGLICLHLLGVTVCSAQDVIKPIKVGDTAPNFAINNILNYSQPSTTLSQLNTGDLLILDFWATWCGPCVRAFPKLDSLQGKFQDKINIVAVTSESKEKVSLFLQKQKAVKNILPLSVVEDKLLKYLFPHNALPHYVWLDKYGKVVAITGEDQVNEANIDAHLSNQSFNLPTKVDVFQKIDRGKLFFLSKPQIEVSKDMVIFKSNKNKYQSILLGRVPILTPGGRFREHSLTVENNSLKGLIAMVWGEGRLEFLFPNRTILNVKDSAMFMQMSQADFYTDWADSNLYNYELVVRDTTSEKNEKFKLAQNDIDSFLKSRGISARMETLPVKVLALIRTSSIDKIKSDRAKQQVTQNAFYYKLENASIDNFVRFLMHNWQTEYPLDNETNYTGNIDIELNANMSSVESVNKELEKYDLKIVEKEKLMEMIVIEQK